MAITALPTKGSTDWFQWATDMDAAARLYLTAVNVRDYGAKGDNSTDDKTAIQNAIAAVAARTATYSSGAVMFPAGVYTCTAQLTVPKNITLIGEGAGGSVLLFTGATDAAGVFLTFGASGTINTNGGVRGLQIDSNNKLAWTLRMYGPQEGSVISTCLIRGGTLGGLDCRSQGIEGGNNKFLIEGSWIWANGSAALYGAKFDDANGPFAIRDSTLVRTGGGTAPAGSAGLYFNGGLSLIDNVNCEQWESHTNQDAWTRSTGRLLSSYGCTYGVTVRQTSGADPNISYQFETTTFDSATYVLRDLQTNTLITDLAAYRRHGPNQPGIKAVAGNYTPVFDDARMTVSISGTSTVTIPAVDNNGCPWRRGIQLTFVNTGTGVITFTAGSGVTLNSAAGKRITAQYGSAMLRMIDWDNWVIVGGQTVT